MGLDSFLRRSEIRAKFLQEFPKPNVSRKKEILAPRITDRPQHLGKAFDYLLRFYIKRLNPQTFESEWTAEVLFKDIFENVNLLAINPIGRILKERLIKIISEARENYTMFLEKTEMDIKNNLIESVIFLANIDQLGYFNPELGVSNHFWVIKDKDVQDLRNLISAVDPALFKTDDICILNPMFEETSAFGRAAGDLVVGDVLIDIKTVKDSKFDRRYFNQLMAYYTLYRIGGITGLPPEKTINKVGVYFSRYGNLALLDIEDIVNEKTFPLFMKWFKNEATE